MRGLTRLVLIVLLAANSLWLVSAPPAVAKRRPNILVIVVEDTRVDALKGMSNLRRQFRERGTRFARAFAATPLSLTRASILSGRYGHNTGVRLNPEAWRLDQRSTIQRFLRQADYRTAIAGRFLNGWGVRRDPPYFQRWAVFGKGYYNTEFNVDGRRRSVNQYATDFVADRAVESLRWFEKRDARPWFLYVATTAAHGPFEPAREYRYARVPAWKPNPAVKEDDRTDKPEFVQEQSVDAARARRTRRQQIRTLKSVDDLVGRVMRELGRLGEKRRTLAFFLADHGYFWAEHGLGDKRLPYTQAIRFPLFMRWPGHVPQGAVDRRLVVNVDLAPTIMDAAGVGPAAEYAPDGRSLLGSESRDRALTEHWQDPRRPIPDWASLRTAEYQYVEYYDPEGIVTFTEYYDLVNDPWQLENLLADSDEGSPPPADVALLSARLQDDRKCRGTEGSGACP